MSITSNTTASIFSYVPGGNKIGEITERVMQISEYLASSPVYQSNVANFGYLLTLPPVDPLPASSSMTTGSLALSGSGANIKLYVFTGRSTNFGWASASLA